MTNLLLMIELTVSFYATQVIWQVGTLRTRTDTLASHPKISGPIIQFKCRRRRSPPLSRACPRPSAVHRSRRAHDGSRLKGWRWPRRPHRKDFTDTSTAAALI